MVFFFIVGTNCWPVAESLSSCLLKISGKARGGRGRHSHMEREACPKSLSPVLTAGHPAEKHSPPLFILHVGIPIDRPLLAEPLLLVFF